MKRFATCFLLLLGLLGPLSSARAQVAWRDLPPEDRRQLRQQMREHWEQERELREMRREMRQELRRDDMPVPAGPRWRELAPEDRRRIRDEMREQRGWPERGERSPGGRGWRRD